MNKNQKKIVIEWSVIVTMLGLSVIGFINKDFGQMVLKTIACIVCIAAVLEFMYIVITAIKSVIEDFKVAGFLTNEEFQIYKYVNSNSLRLIPASELMSRCESLDDWTLASNTENEIMRMADDFLHKKFRSRDDYDLSFMQRPNKCKN